MPSAAVQIPHRFTLIELPRRRRQHWHISAPDVSSNRITSAER